MQLICKDGAVLATHDDAQVLPAEAYGEGVTVIRRAEGLAGLDRLGDPPPEGVADHRPFAAPAVPLAAVRAEALAAVDAEAERQRQRWITPGAGQALTYQRKAEEARAALAAADPQPADYPMLAACLGIDGATIAAVAAVVQARDAAWGRIGSAIETRRLTLKRDIAAADAAALAAIDHSAGWPDVA